MTNGRWANPLPVGLITMCSNSVEKSVPWWKSGVRFLSLGSLLSILNDREPCGCCLLSSSWVPKKVMCTLQSSRKEWILWNVMAFMATWRCCCLPSSGAHSFQITQCFAQPVLKSTGIKKEVSLTIKIYSIKEWYLLLLIFTMALMWRMIPHYREIQINPSTFAKSMIFKAVREKYLFIRGICHHWIYHYISNWNAHPRFSCVIPTDIFFLQKDMWF